MKLASATVSKGFGRTDTHPRPQEGTRLRRMFDLFVKQKGCPVEISLTWFEGKNSSALVEQLRDCYGLDLRRLSNKRWVLAGEWFGDFYVDYIADKLTK